MKKFGIGISVTFNIILLAVIIWFITGGFFKTVNKYMLEPLYERWTTQFELLAIQPDDTVFLGDSITEGGKWHELFPDAQVRNRGIFGDFTEGVIKRLDQIVDAKPAKIFLMIGINDLSFGIPQKDIITNIVSIIEKIHTKSPNTKVYVQSLLPRAAAYQNKIEAFNIALKSTIPKKAIWVNLYPLFLDKTKKFIDPELSNDELHLLGKGYIVWRDAINYLVK